MKFPTYEEMCQEVANMVLDEYEYKGKTLRQWIEIISATEHGTNLAEVGTDCISRQDALEAFGLSEKTRKYGGDHSGYATMMMYEIQDTIENLPPIQQKKGRWIKLDMHRGMADHKCSVCEQECYVPTCMGEPMYAFCPNCGAMMKGENSESN